MEIVKCFLLTALVYCAVLQLRALQREFKNQKIDLLLKKSDIELKNLHLEVLATQYKKAGVPGDGPQIAAAIVRNFPWT
jgi:hypothetical protein